MGGASWRPAVAAAAHESSYGEGYGDVTYVEVDEIVTDNTSTLTVMTPSRHNTSVVPDYSPGSFYSTVRDNERQLNAVV